MGTLNFYHDENLKEPFNLFEDIIVKNSIVDVKNNKIKIGQLRTRKFNTMFTSSTGAKINNIIGSFKINNVKYYFNYK